MEKGIEIKNALCDAAEVSTTICTPSLIILPLTPFIYFTQEVIYFEIFFEKCSLYIIPCGVYMYICRNVLHLNFYIYLSSVLKVSISVSRAAGTMFAKLTDFTCAGRSKYLRCTCRRLKYIIQVYL